MTIELAAFWSNIAVGIITIVGFVATAFGLYYGLRASVDRQSDMIRATSDMQSERLGVFGGRIINLEVEVKELKEVLVQLATQDERIINIRRDQTQMNERMNRIQEQLNTLDRRGWSKPGNN